jgi:hypothetical protein
MDIEAFAQIFTAVLVAFVVAERLVHALSFTLWYVIVGVNYTNTRKQSSSKSLAGMGVLRTALGSTVSLVSSVLSAFANALGSMSQWIFAVATMVVVMGMLFLALEYAGSLMIAVSDTWNRIIGPSAQVLVMWPMRLANLLFSALVPLWNAVIWLWKKVPSQILVSTVTNDMGTLVNIARAFAAAARASALSVVGWIGSFVCCEDGGSGGALSALICNPRCYEAGERIFDFLSPLASIRQMVVYLAMWLRGMCGTLSGPVDVLTYPFMDINFAKGVHFLTNAVMYTATHLPALTARRCSAFGAESPVMCIPDVEPVFQMASVGLRSMGQFIDNWLDVTVLIVEAALGRAPPACTQLPDMLRDISFQSAFFGTNATVIAGMTEVMFARTDGLSVQYFSLSRDWQTVLHPGAFPFQTDVSYGIAAVAHISDLHHSTNGDDTMALLGCSCADDPDTGMVLTCGAAVYDDQVSLECFYVFFIFYFFLTTHTNTTQQTDVAERTIPVIFQLASTARFMSCSKVKIKLQSLRWPASRNTASRLAKMDGSSAPPDFSCRLSKGVCVQVRRNPPRGRCAPL